MVPPSSPSHWRGRRRASTSTVADVRRLAGRPRALQISTAYPDVTRPTRRSIPRFAHESYEISKAVYQALPLCIADKAVASYAPPTLEGGHCGLSGRRVKFVLLWRWRRTSADRRRGARHVQQLSPSCSPFQSFQHSRAIADSVKLRPGIKVERTSTNSVTVSRMRRPSVTGGFDCSCSHGSNGGSCTITIKSDFILCSKGARDTCNQTCELGTTISGNLGAWIARGRVTRKQP
jgi:hypothetical protein